MADQRTDLTEGEIAALRRGGLDLRPVARKREDPLLRAAVSYSALLATSYDVPQVARLLGVDRSRVRQRLAARTLYGIKRTAGWRLPRFQFAEDRPLPGLEVVLARLRPEVHPLVLYRWFTTPNPDLVDGEGEDPVSPRDWLLAGGDPATVGELAVAL